MAVFVEAGRGRRKWEARKSISGAVRGSPGRAVQAGIRGIELMRQSAGFHKFHLFAVDVRQCASLIADVPQSGATPRDSRP